MNDLGQLEKSYGIMWQTRLVLLLLCLISVLMGAGAIFASFLDNSDKGMPFVRFFITYGMGAFFIFIGIWLLYKFFQKKNDCFQLYEQGFIQISLGKVQTACWDEIENLYLKAIVYTSRVTAVPVYEFTMTGFKGEKFIVENILNEIEQIGTRLKAEVYGRRLPILIEKFYRGETIKFGQFSLNQQYLFSESRPVLPLLNFWKIELHDGAIKIYQKDDWKIWDSAEFASIPNVSILTTILEKCR